MKRPGIAVENYGGQYAPQIGKFVRQQGVWSEMVLPDTPKKYFENALGIIHSGSRRSVSEKDAPLPRSEVLELPIPQFGFCYGQQAMQKVLGGEVVSGGSGEYGVSTLHILDNTDIFQNLGKEEQVLMSHRDVVVKPAPGHERIGYTDTSPNAAIRDKDKRLFGVQFHPEVYQTPNGNRMISNFLDICECKRDWNPGDLLEEKMEMIRKKAGDSYVIVLASGGKDSTTSTLMAQKVLDPEKTLYLHVDTGLERKGEAENARDMLNRAGITKNLHINDASDMIFDRLNGVSEPNKKRVIIGDSILDAADQLAERFGIPNNYKLLQGTLLTDTVESSGVTGTEDEIKIHHNLTPRTRELRKQGRMIEPLSDFYKDDTIKLAPIVGTPQKVTGDEPMPGPGLGVRILCIPDDFTYDSKRIENADRLASSISKEYSLKSHTRPYTTVGVQGDTRTEVHPAIVEGSIDERIFREFSKKLTDSVKDISRVWYLLEPERIKSMEVLKGRFITKDRVERLREFEYVTKEVMKNHRSEVGKITQFPLFLIPESINGGDETLVYRPFFSLDYMTGESVWLPKTVTDDVTNAVFKANKRMGYNEIAVALEGEGKPPGTTELE
jgi:GMP synthase (glutamine-hydrolysing)